MKNAGSFCSGRKVVDAFVGFFHGLVIFISENKCLLRSDVRFDSFSS